MFTANNTESREVVLSEIKLTYIGLPFTLIVILSALLYYCIWDVEPLFWGVKRFFSLMCIPVVFTGLFLNEFFYRLTLAIFCRYPMSKFWYGFNFGQIMKCGDREIPAGVKYYRLALVLPHIIVGLFPLILGISINHPLIYIFGILFTLASIGDIVLLWEIRNINDKNQVCELPSREGVSVQGGELAD